MSRYLLFLIAITIASMAGCASILHELKPHRLHKLNRHPPPSIDPEFTALPKATSLV